MTVFLKIVIYYIIITYCYRRKKFKNRFLNCKKLQWSNNELQMWTAKNNVFCFRYTLKYVGFICFLSLGNVRLASCQATFTRKEESVSGDVSKVTQAKALNIKHNWI